MTKKAEVEVFSDESNAVVLQTPGRKFPGIVVQGDSLNALCDLALEATKSPDMIQVLYEKLSLFRERYEKALMSHGIELPYPRRGK